MNSSEFRRVADGQTEAVPSRFSVGALLQRPVLLHGILLGQPVDVVLDTDAMRVVGIEVWCGDEASRFLPLPAARIMADEIAVPSALMLLDERDIGFYRRRARQFRVLRGVGVEREGRRVGELDDLEIGHDGKVTAVHVRASGSHRRIALDETVRLAAPGRASAP